MARLIADIPDNILEAILTGEMDNEKLMKLRQYVKKGVQLSDDVILNIQSGNIEIHYDLVPADDESEEDDELFDAIALDQYKIPGS